MILCFIINLYFSSGDIVTHYKQAYKNVKPIKKYEECLKEAKRLEDELKLGIKNTSIDNITITCKNLPRHEVFKK